MPVDVCVCAYVWASMQEHTYDSQGWPQETEIHVFTERQECWQQQVHESFRLDTGYVPVDATNR